jgi:hypothetical protein
MPDALIAHSAPLPVVLHFDIMPPHQNSFEVDVYTQFIKSLIIITFKKLSCTLKYASA